MTDEELARLDRERIANAGALEPAHLRGIGTSLRQLQKLRDGDIFVVSSHAMRVYTKMLMDKHAITARIEIVVLDSKDDGWRLRGTPAGRTIVPDHAVYLSSEADHLIRAHNGRH